jgi:hypothetical protein
VQCGKETDAGHAPRCTAGQVCCVQNPADLGPPATYTCQAPSAACAGTVVSCAHDSDCQNGQVCCGVLPFTSRLAYASVACTSECVADGGLPYEFCDRAAPACSAAKAICYPSMYLSGYAVCLAR